MRSTRFSLITISLIFNTFLFIAVNAASAAYMALGPDSSLGTLCRFFHEHGSSLLIGGICLILISITHFFIAHFTNPRREPLSLSL